MKKRLLSIFLALLMVLALLPASVFAAASLKAPTISIARSSGKPKISWSAVSGAKKYYIYRSTDGKTYSYLTNTTSTSYTNTGAASGTKYYYKVKAAKVSNGKTVYSAYSNAKNLLTTIATPTVTVTLTSGKPTVKWSALKGADKYEVYRSTDGKTYSKYVTTTKTSYTNTNASIGTTYYYKVKAISTATSAANSALSAAKSIKCIPATPTLTVTATDTSAKLSWGAVTGATKYEIYRSTDGKSFSKYVTTTKTAYTNSKLTEGKTYYYKVRALAVVKNTSVYSVFSSVKSVKMSEAYADIKWTLKDGVLTISGSGKMPDYDWGSNQVPWNSYKDQITKVVINKGITSIGAIAFSGCYRVTSITIPSGVTSIGEAALNECRSLTSVSLPNSVTSIGDGAFYCCKSLTSITIPSGVKSIGKDAFMICDKLTSINVSSDNSAYTSRDGVLYNKAMTKLICCPGAITSVTIPSGVTSIEEDAFYYSASLANVSIPNSVTSIGEDAFYSCDCLTAVTIPGSVTSIGDGAFYGSSKLASVTLKNGIKSIAHNAFAICDSLKSITIPSSVTSISNTSFSSCDSLTNISVASENTAYASYDGALYNKALTTLICCPAGKSSIAFANGVTSIGDDAIRNNSKLTSVTIPNGVTSIGDSGFYGCSYLSTIIIPSSVTSIGDSAFGFSPILYYVYYRGTEAQWAKISIGSSNSYLTNANIQCNYTGA